MRRTCFSILSLFLLLLLFVSSVKIGLCQAIQSKIDKKDLACFIKTLTSEQFAGRGLEYGGHLKTQEFIISRFKELLIEPYFPDGYLEKFMLNQTVNGKIIINLPPQDREPDKENNQSKQVEKSYETANVVGFIPGASDLVIIISAHYDHVGKQDTIYYPGADDNASGVAALLELAEEFAQNKPLKYPLIFLATAAEEYGLLGSSFYVEQPHFNADKVFCHLNIDMISRCDVKHTDCAYLYCMWKNTSSRIDSLIREADNQFPLCSFDYSENGSGIFSHSDSQSFYAKGAPSILFFSGFHDDYHRPTDTMDKIDFDIYENRVRLIGEVVKCLQRDTNPAETIR